MKLKFEEKVKIWELHDSGLTSRQIAKELDYAVGTVKNALEEYQDYKDIQLERED